MLETAEAVTAAAWDVASVAPSPIAVRRAVGVRRRRGRRDRLRRRGRGRQGLHPGARRDRVHLRARRPPLPAPGAEPARDRRRRRRGRRAADRPRRSPACAAGSSSTSRAATRRSGAERAASRSRRIAALPPDERRAGLVETGYLTPHWPAPYGLGADAVTQIVIDQELARAGLTRPDIVIAGLGAADDPRARHRRAARAVREAVAARRPGVVPAVLRAGRRLRPGVAAHPRGEGRRRLAADRPEGLELGRRARRLGHLPGAHRTRRPRSTRASPTSWST